MPPEFSVVLPTYGRPDVLGEAIASVLAQTFGDFECVVVDDSGPDGTELPSDDPRLRLVRRSINGGPAAARNTGIMQARGRYVAFLDDDDVWTPDRLDRAREAHERAAVAVCWQTTLGERPRSRAGRILEGDVGDTILDAITPHLGATSIERVATPPFDERYRGSEDVEWWLRVSKQLAVTTIPHIGLQYRRHEVLRAGATRDDRTAGSCLLLEDHADYFAAHPRAKAFRLKRMGLVALQVDDRALARRYFASAIRLRPEPRTVWHALRACTPRRSMRAGA